MSTRYILKNFFVKSLIPISATLLLLCIFKSACVKNGETNYVMLWILCGIPFGLYKLHFLITLNANSMACYVSQCALILALGGAIGGIIMVWRLIIAAWYVLVTIYHLLLFCIQQFLNRIYNALYY